MERLIEQISELRKDHDRMERLHQETEEKDRKLRQKEKVILLILLYL